MKKIWHYSPIFKYILSFDRVSPLFGIYPKGILAKIFKDTKVLIVAVCNNILDKIVKLIQTHMYIPYNENTLQALKRIKTICRW